MTITASLCKSIPLRADLPTATAAAAHFLSRGRQLDQSSSINKTALDCIYPLVPSCSSKQPISSTGRHTDHASARSKSP
jgi:hypothetical protein